MEGFGHHCFHFVGGSRIFDLTNTKKETKGGRTEEKEWGGGMMSRKGESAVFP